jgi:hypothetical protein
MISLSLEIIEILLDVSFDGLIPRTLKVSYDAWETSARPSDSAMQWAIVLFGFGLFVVGIVATFGLIFFKRWGRVLAIGQSLLAVAFYPIWGSVIMSGWTEMLSLTSEMLWGAGLAMAYFSDIKERFQPD